MQAQAQEVPLNQTQLADFSDVGENLTSENTDQFGLGTVPVVFDEGESDLDIDQEKHLEKIAARLRSNSRSRIEIKVWRQSAEQESQNVAERQATTVKKLSLREWSFS